MILRLVVLMVSGGLAYAMLQGWPDFLPRLLRACLAVLLLVGGLSWWAIGRKSDELPVAEGARKPGWLDFSSIGMGLLALECGFLWMLNVAPAPLEDIAVRLEARFRPEAAGLRANGKDGNPVGGNWLWQNERSRSLPARTNLKPGAKPEVFVRIAKREDAIELLKEQVYVRAFVLDRYRDGVWSLSGTDELNLEAGDDGWIRFGEEDEEEILHQVFHGKDPSGRDVLTALQGARAVRLPSLNTSGDGMAYLPEIGDKAGYDYFASSVPMTLKDLEGSDVEAARKIGGASDARIRELALRAAGEGGLLKRLQNIEDFLRNNYGYSLVTDNPRNLEPLENFLFAEKRGHCEFFATAGALMAREIGVEARLAYGWAGGQFFEENNMFVFRAREAHSWVEVNLAGYGWVLMEPTPPVVLGEDGRSSVADAGDEFPSPEEVLAESECLVDNGSEGVAAIALGLTVFFGLGAACVIFMREKTKPAAEGSKVYGAEQGSGYFAAWRRALKKRGFRGEGKTLKKQIEGLEDTASFGGELVRYHYGLKYEENAPDSKKEKRLEKAIREWEEGR